MPRLNRLVHLSTKAVPSAPTGGALYLGQMVLAFMT
jgi:hypothetical protein